MSGETGKVSIVETLPPAQTVQAPIEGESGGQDEDFPGGFRSFGALLGSAGPARCGTLFGPGSSAGRAEFDHGEVRRRLPDTVGMIFPGAVQGGDRMELHGASCSHPGDSHRLSLFEGPSDEAGGVYFLRHGKEGEDDLGLLPLGKGGNPFGYFPALFLSEFGRQFFKFLEYLLPQ